MSIVGGSHEWTIAVAYALFMAASGFVLVPDQTHALNQLPSSMNAGSAGMNAIQQLAGAIVLATGGYTALFPVAVVAVLLGTVFIMLIRKVK